MEKVYNSLSLSLEDKLVFLSRDNFNKVNFKGIGDASCVVYPFFYLIFEGSVKLKIRPEGSEKVKVAISWGNKEGFPKKRSVK